MNDTAKLSTGSIATLPILIAGAGPTGMAAPELARLAILLRIIDQALAPALTSRAIGVQGPTMELMGMRGFVG
jgi:2-polyprenyl-6-methoxyphenol hydroxylase-like FAD-dependent oxidoreductase